MALCPKCHYHLLDCRCYEIKQAKLERRISLAYRSITVFLGALLALLFIGLVFALVMLVLEWMLP